MSGQAAQASWEGQAKLEEATAGRVAFLDVSDVLSLLLLFVAGLESGVSGQAPAKLEDATEPGGSPGASGQGHASGTCSQVLAATRFLVHLDDGSAGGHVVSNPGSGQGTPSKAIAPTLVDGWREQR